MEKINSGLDNELIEKELEEIKVLLYNGSKNIEQTEELLNEKLNNIQTNNNLETKEKLKLLEQVGDLLFGIGNYETGMELYNHISNLIENPLEEVELYRKKINFLLAYIDYKDNYNKDIFDNIKNETKEKILKNTIKEISTGELNFNLGLVEEKQNNKAEALKYFKTSAYEDYEYGVYKYLEELEDNFLEKYNKLQSNEEKQDFLDKNLEDFEEEYYKFIDGIKDIDRKIIKKGNKELYGNIGEFYEKIGFYSDALSAYIDGTSKTKKGYIFYSKIADLYLTDKINLKVLSKSNLEIAKENYNLLLSFSRLNNDLENFVLALEKLGDVFLKENNKNEAEIYYVNALNNLKNNNIFEEVFVERLSQKIVNISDDNVNIYNSLQNLVNINIDNLLSVAMYYEQKGHTEYAFYNYLLAFEQLDEEGNHIIKESTNALSMFIETTLLEKTINDSRDFFKRIGIDENEIIENILEDDEILEEIEYQKEQQNEEIKIKKMLIKKIVERIDKEGKLLREDIATLFEMSILNDIFDEDVTNNIEKFLSNYINKNPNSDIYLHRILQNIIIYDGGNKENILIKEILKKIYNKKELSSEDIKNIMLIVSLSNEKKEENYEYADKLREIWKKSIK